MNEALARRGSEGHNLDRHTWSVGRIFFNLLRLCRMTLKAFSLESRVDDHGLSPDCHRLSVCRTAPFRLVGRTDLARCLGQNIETIEILACSEGQVHRLALTLPCHILVLVAIGEIGKFVESQQDALPIAQRDGLTLLHEMVGQTVDATLGEFLAASFARVLVAITGVLEFLASNEELEDELVRFATH